MKKIILASASPRRKALLEQIGLEFTVDTRVQEGAMPSGQEPHRLAKEISLKKAQSVADCHPDAIIISADTFIVLDGRLMGKPHSESEANAMLASLSGRTHTVITGFTIIDTLTNKALTRSVETAVHMRRMEPSETECYVKTGEPMDAAGSYAIQGIGAIFIERIEGDYFNVVGLPLCALADALKEFGVKVL